MSTRALRKLEKTETPIQEPVSDAKDECSEDQIDVQPTVNRFAFLVEDKDDDSSEDGTPVDRVAIVKKKAKKKQKRKPPRADASADFELDAAVESIEKHNMPPKKDVESVQVPQTLFDESSLLRVEYKHMRAQNELSRMFGVAVRSLGSGSAEATAIQRGTNRKRASQHTAGGKIIQLKPGAVALISKTGLSMNLIDKSATGVLTFRFEHSAIYQKAQQQFWLAVEKMNPELFLEILRQNPCHVDTLLQMSDVYRMNEDFGTSRELVEKAIATCEVAFHPLFNPVTSNCRLFYRQQENRPFFLALFKQIQYLCQRACFRTALEFSKLCFSLDPDNDSLGVLLMLDYLCLRSKQFDYLINFYHIFDAKRNLSLLPNFCYSVALAKFMDSQKSGKVGQTDDDGSISLREAVQKFPTFIPVLLDRCSVEPDTSVTSCEAFSAKECLKDGKGLQLLYHTYVCRSWALWKEPGVMLWLETNVGHCVAHNLLCGSAQPFATYRGIRQSSFVTTPLNVCRHILLAGEEVRGASAYLPADVQQTTLRSHDPLPPVDSVCDYGPQSRPERSNHAQGSVMTTFLRSLMPNYDPEVEAAADTPPGQTQDFQQSVQNVLRAMRDLLNDIQLTAPPREDQPPADDWADEQD